MEALDQPNLRALSSPWQDLPSHAGRVRLGAVCRSWRDGTRMQPPLPPLLPWILQCDGTFLSLPDGEVHRLKLIPDDVNTGKSVGSILFIMHINKGCSLVNPLSQETTARQHIDLRRRVHSINKVVVVYNHVTVFRTGNKMYGELKFSIRKPDSPTLLWGWSPPSDTCYYYILDMALFHEKLYVLTGTCDGMHPLLLYAINFVDDKLVGIRCIINTPKDDMDQRAHHGLPNYLVASDDRLLMVQQKRKLDCEPPIQLLTQPLFEVFEAADMSSSHGRWRKINTLMGRALFLSEGCSESLPAAGGQCFGPQSDCIYFLDERSNNDERTGRVYSGVYNIREGTMSPLPLEKDVARDGPWTTTWFFLNVA